MNEGAIDYTNPENLLFNPAIEQRIGVNSEKEEYSDLLLKQIAEIIERRANSWPVKPDENDIISPSGIKTPAGKRLQVNAAIHGHQIGAERIFTESIPQTKAKAIQTVRLHFVMEASPTALAFKSRQRQAYELLASYCELDTAKINAFFKSATIKELDKNIQFWISTKNGVYNLNTNQTLTPSDVDKQYRDALRASVSESSLSPPRLNDVGKDKRISEMLSQSKDDQEAGILNIHILAGEPLRELPSFFEDLDLETTQESDLIFIPLDARKPSVSNMRDRVTQRQKLK